jgi:hypothetical protein
MRTISKLWPVLLLAACLDEVATNDTQQASITTDSNNRRTVTRIRVNGRSVDVLLANSATGFLNASRDQIANTSALDFSYASPDPANPDFVILIQGAGAIPNSALTFTQTGARLDVTTPFEVTRCVLNTIDGTSVCAPTSAVSFNLTWTQNGLSSIFEKTTRIETLGPVETKVKGEFTSVSALVSGTFGGHTTTNNQGNLLDSQSTTIIREITRRLRP